MRVLDLFSGLGGWARPFRDRGHRVTTLDLDPRFGCDITADILTVENLGDLGAFDVVVASPPCEAFSVASIGAHWAGGRRAYEPKSDTARLGLDVMRHTFMLVTSYAPRFYVIENPRGVMRKVAPQAPDLTVWYCRLGERRAKPTDLWTNIPPMVFPEPCRNNSPDCDHERAPRGARTGTQGLSDAAQRAVVPYALGLTVCLFAENERAVA